VWSLGIVLVHAIRQSRSDPQILSLYQCDLHLLGGMTNTRVDHRVAPIPMFQPLAFHRASKKIVYSYLIPLGRLRVG